MTTWTALTTTASEVAANDIAGGLESLSPVAVGVFELEDGSGLWEVGGYFDGPPDAVALALLAAAHDAAGFAVSKVEPRDWVAQVRRELSPVRAGRFIVHGGHDPDAAPPPLIGLRIEAAMAFGTGHHATTQGCLLALGRIARRRRPRRIADIGCGTGVLAMAAVRLWRAPAVASDIDPVAALTARANARANRTGAMMRVLAAPGFNAPALREGPRFDLVFANILARPLKRLAPRMAARIAPGGFLVLSGILTGQAKGVEAVYRAHGFARAARLAIGDWVTLTLRRS
jgi:ribosomal protein L11 methyltransferase